MIRVLYTVLSAFAPAAEYVTADGQVRYSTETSGLSKFSATSGDWVIFLLMSVATEYIVVIIYTVTGYRNPGDDQSSQSDIEK